VSSAALTKLLFSNEVYLSAQFFGWQMGFNHVLQRNYNDHVGKTIAFYVWSAALTVIGFLLLRALSRFGATTEALRRIAGPAVVGTPPICLWLVGWYRPDLYSGRPLLDFEGCAVVGCAVLYAIRRWPFALGGTCAALTLHGAAWCYAYWISLGHFGLCWITTPVSAYLSTIVWGYYVHRGGPTLHTPGERAIR
jgi:hypothetical protein